MVWITVDGDDEDNAFPIFPACGSSVRACVLDLLTNLGGLKFWPGMVGFA